MLQLPSHLSHPLLDLHQFLSLKARHSTSCAASQVPSRREVFYSLNLLALLFLIQPHMQLAFFAEGRVAESCPTSCPRSSFPNAFPWELLSNDQPQTVVIYGIIPCHRQDFTFILVELDEILVHPFLHLVKVLLNGNPDL